MCRWIQTSQAARARLAVEPLLAGDLATVLAELQAGLGFVKQG